MAVASAYSKSAEGRAGGRGLEAAGAGGQSLAPSATAKSESRTRDGRTDGRTDGQREGGREGTPSFGLENGEWQISAWKWRYLGEGRERKKGWGQGREGTAEYWKASISASLCRSLMGMREEKEGRKEGWKGAMVDYSDARMSQTHMLPACPWLTKLDFLD